MLDFIACAIYCWSSWPILLYFKKKTLLKLVPRVETCIELYLYIGYLNNLRWFTIDYGREGLGPSLCSFFEGENKTMMTIVRKRILVLRTLQVLLIKNWLQCSEWTKCVSRNWTSSWWKDLEKLVMLWNWTLSLLRFILFLYIAVLNRSH